MRREELDVLRGLVPLFDGEKRTFSELENSYFSFYGLDKIGGEHYFAKIPSIEENIIFHYFRHPDESKKTAILMHGYYTHSGYPVKLAKFLFDKGYNIITYDMPGHGLSTGKRLEIGSFSLYTQVLIDILDVTRKAFCQGHEITSFGHSTGAVPIFDAALQEIDLGLEKSFVLAPLIRSNHYKLTRLSFQATNKFISQITRKFRVSSHDEDFLKFISSEPLQERFVPSSWIKCMFEWNDRFEKFVSGDQKIIALQGDQDGTVEWKTNLEIIRHKFPNSKTHVIEGAEHQLMNESDFFMEKVFAIITNEL